jgi:hypothetical protein
MRPAIPLILVALAGCSSDRPADPDFRLVESYLKTHLDDPAFEVVEWRPSVPAAPALERWQAANDASDALEAQGRALERKLEEERWRREDKAIDDALEAEWNASRERIAKRWDATIAEAGSDEERAQLEREKADSLERLETSRKARRHSPPPEAPNPQQPQADDRPGVRVITELDRLQELESPRIARLKYRTRNRAGAIEIRDELFIIAGDEAQPAPPGLRDHVDEPGAQ